MAFSAGRLQRVETVDDSGSDDDSGPPPLEDLDSAEGRALDDSNDKPSLLMSGPKVDEGSSSAGQDGDGSDAEEENEHDKETDDRMPSLTGGSEEEEDALDEQPHDLDNSTDPESGSDSMPVLEAGTEEIDESEEDDDEDDYDAPCPAEPMWPELQRGFLDRGKKQQSSYSNNSNAGVGQCEEGPAAAARIRSGERASASYACAGAGARESVRGEQHPYGRSKGSAGMVGMTPDESAAFLHPGGAAAAGSSAVGQPLRKQQAGGWQTNDKQKKKKERRPPEPPPSAAPAGPTEVVVANEALLAMEKEREEARRRANMAQEAEAAAPQSIGRCCLNRGLGDAVMHCLKDPSTSRLWPNERRVQMRCSVGCVMLWHQECWRRFQDGYEQETRGGGELPHGINITQALKVRDKAKPPLVRCVTPHCPGYINFLGSFDGPVGHETFKSMQYQPTQDNLAAIKQAEEADRAAAKAAAAEAHAAAKQQRDAAALAAWRQRTHWVPKGPKKPRAKPLQAEQQQRRAAAKGSSTIDAELLGILGGPLAAKRAAAAEAAAAAAAAAAASKTGGITIMNRGISIVHVKQQDQQQQLEETGSPLAASVEGSTTASQSASQGPQSSRDPDPLATLGSSRASDHIDRAYHSNLDDMLAQMAAGAAAGGKRGKKKKGVRVDLSTFQAVGGEEYSQPQQPLQPHLPSPPGRQQQQQQAPVSMADFPSLDEAAQAAGEEMPQEKDYLAEALNKLKLGIGDETTPYLLLENLSFYAIRREGQDPERVVKQLVFDKVGHEPVAVLLFEKQDAAAVVLPDANCAAQLNMLLFRHIMHRKPLLASSLRAPPYPDVLHEACPQYLPPGYREQQEMAQAMQELNLGGGGIGGGIDKQRMAELANQVKQGHLTPLQLLEKIEWEQQQAGSLACAGAGSSRAAAAPAGAAAAMAAASASRAVARPGLPLPPPPPPPQPQPQRGLHAQPGMAQRVAQQQLLVPQMGYGMVMQPMQVPVAQAGYAGMPMEMPVASMPGAVCGGVVYPMQQQTWQQQQFAYLQQRQQQQQQQFTYLQQQQQHGVYTVQHPVATAADSDWAGNEEMYDDDEQQQEAGGSGSSQPASYMGGGQVQVDEEGGLLQEGQQQQQQRKQAELEARLESRGRSAAAGSSSMERSTSGSPSTKVGKLNPLAKEFNFAGLSAATAAAAPAAPAAAPSRLQAASSTSSKDTSSGLTSSLAALSVTERPPAAGTAARRAADGTPAAAAAAAAGGAAAANSSSSAAAAMASTPAAQQQQQQAPFSSQPTAAPAAAAAGIAATSAAAPAAAPAAAAAAATAAAAGAHISNDGVIAGSTAAGAAGVLPADHIVDVVHLAGCNNQLLGTSFRNPLAPSFTLPHSTLQEAHRIAVSESAGLILYNNETGNVEGLWVATDNSERGIMWRPVAEYKGVPASVYTRVLQLQPFRSRYVGQEATNIIQALWGWAHPMPQPTPAAGAAAARLGSMAGSSSGAMASVQQPQQLAHAACAPSSRPGSSGAAALAAAPAASGSASRTLPPMLQMLVNRPGSAGSSTGAAPAAAATAAPASAEPRPPSAGGQAVAPAAAAAAGGSASGHRGRKLCTLCHARPAAWLVWECKQMGPCLECCPKPADIAPGEKYYMNPPAYPTCLQCNGPCTKLFRVMT